MPVLLIIVPLLAMLALNLPWMRLMNRLALWVGLGLCLVQALLVITAPAFLWEAPALGLGRLLLFEPSMDYLSLVMFLAIAIVGAVALMVCRYSVHVTDFGPSRASGASDELSRAAKTDVPNKHCCVMKRDGGRPSVPRRQCNSTARRRKYRRFTACRN